MFLGICKNAADQYDKLPPEIKIEAQTINLKRMEHDLKLLVGYIAFVLTLRVKNPVLRVRYNQ